MPPGDPVVPTLHGRRRCAANSDQLSLRPQHQGDVVLVEVQRSWCRVFQKRGIGFLLGFRGGSRKLVPVSVLGNPTFEHVDNEVVSFVSERDILLKIVFESNNDPIL